MDVTDTVPGKGETAHRARAVLYLRVSTERQARSGGEVEGYSIPAQRDICRAKAESLGAEVIEEYVDAGASAKTADRVALQEMLARLESKADIDYVIVHKLDRLARSRMDDVLIMAAIERAGGALVSCVENIDESPQGKLLHGIMASMAEFYVQNLASEVKKGLHKKAKAGGTPGPCPIGYLNGRRRVEGIDVKTVELDEERAPHLRWLFESYATGEWSLSEVTDELRRRGLTTRETRRYAGRPLTRSQVHRVLSNHYYLGKVHYGGVLYEGRHEALVDEETFDVVQIELQRRKVAGERAWKRRQYLKGSVFCFRCGERLGFGHNTGKSGGVYAYFFCLGRHRKRTSCDLPYLPAARVEGAVIQEWEEVTFSPALVATARQSIADEFAEMASRNKIVLREQKKRVTRLERQRQKLLDGWMDGLIARSDFAERQRALDQGLRDARRLLVQAETEYDGLKGIVETFLKLMERAGRFYRTVPDNVRQTLNQLRYEALYLDVGEDGLVYVADRELTELVAGFEAVADEVREQLGEAPGVHRSSDDAESTVRRWERQLHPRSSSYRGGSQHPHVLRNERRRQRHPAHNSGRGSNLSNLAEREGFEPSMSCPIPLFESGQFNHSCTSPILLV
jgi:site-specific DNA recombinase